MVYKQIKGWRICLYHGISKYKVYKKTFTNWSKDKKLENSLSARPAYYILVVYIQCERSSIQTEKVLNLTVTTQESTSRRFNEFMTSDYSHTHTHRFTRLHLKGWYTAALYIDLFTKTHRKGQRLTTLSSVFIIEHVSSCTLVVVKYCEWTVSTKEENTWN